MRNEEIEALGKRLVMLIGQLERAEAHAAFGGASTGVRVKDAPFLIETLNACQSQLADARRILNCFIATNDDCDGNPGLMDAINDSGEAYQSAFLANAIDDARAFLEREKSND